LGQLAFGTEETLMDRSRSTIAERVAQAAISFQYERTGHAPRAATVVLSGDTLVITLHEALSKAERALAQSPEGAARVQEFHRELFSSSAHSLRQEILRITGVAVRESAAEVEIDSGAVVHAFTSGTMVQVFQLSQTIPQAAWNAPGSDGRASGNGESKRSLPWV
jgi:uncharacterized protein YbcI